MAAYFVSSLIPSKRHFFSSAVSRSFFILVSFSCRDHLVLVFFFVLFPAACGPAADVIQEVKCCSFIFQRPRDVVALYIASSSLLLFL